MAWAVAQDAELSRVIQGTVGRELDKPIPVPYCVFGAAQLVEQPGQMVMHVGIRLVQFQRALKGGSRQIGLTQFKQYAAEVGPRFDKVFVQLE